MSAQEKRENYRHAMSVALRILSARDHSCYELGNKLAKKGFSKSIIGQVMMQCDRLNYLDDHKFAENIVDMIFRKGCGRYYLKAVLKRKGIDSKIIESVIEDGGFEKKEFASAEIAMKKKIKLLNGQMDKEKRLPRLYRYLQSRGFPGDLIHRLLFDYGCF